jgi:hypothetical protein
MTDQDQEMQDVPTESQEFELDGSEYNIRVVGQVTPYTSDLILKSIAPWFYNDSGFF